MNKQIKNRNRPIDIKNKLMVTKGEGKGILEQKIIIKQNKCGQFMEIYGRVSICIIFFEINQKNSKKLDHVEALLPCATSLSTLTEMLSSLLRAAQA